MGYNEELTRLINANTCNIEKETFKVNNGKPIFRTSDYKIFEGKPKYFEPDEYGRSCGAIAIISKNTMPLIIKKKLVYPDPYGWDKSLENKGVFERCHIIAYSLSAKIADKRNIFIGTEYLNTSIMMKIENKIKKYIISNNVRVLYRITVKYKGKNQIPTGILIEAKSLDDDFSLCEFCYNIQKNVIFKYEDGTIIKNAKMEKIKNFINKKIVTKKSKKSKELSDKINNYIINRKTMEFHLYDNNCDKLKNVDFKYLIETTAPEKNLLNVKELKPCKKCAK